MSVSIKKTLSFARIGTYEAAVLAAGSPADALDLYIWNAQISSALLVPLHLCEVSTRNAVDEALSSQYGSRWPWVNAFEMSLPSPSGGYNPRDDLVRVRRLQPSTGKIIPELNFVFWQKMFTQRFDARVWSTQLPVVFPTLPQGPVYEKRRDLHDALEQVRRLRNRIAHHEPIFARNLDVDFKSIELLLKSRCPDTLAWMQSHQTVSQLMKRKPI